LASLSVFPSHRSRGGVTPSKLDCPRGFDVFARDDEFAALAIDMAQHGFGGGDAARPIWLLVSWIFMAIPLDPKGQPTRQIDQA